MIGVQWEATALTNSFVKIGYKEKDFDLATRDTFDAVEWESEILAELTLALLGRS